MPNQGNERDKVLLRMLKTPPKPHNDSGDEIDGLAAALKAGTTDIKRLAKLAGQSGQSTGLGREVSNKRVVSRFKKKRDV